MSQFSQFIEKNKIISFVGTGGVGKTTFAMTTAVAAALEGKKVAAITIDPSKRLSRALGISHETVEKQNLPWDEFKGELDIFVLDAEKTFQDFITQTVPKGYQEKIEKNRIFKQIAKNLRETHNFAAIYKLYQIYKKSEYDLIILDTPPSQAAIDFFEAPEQLQKFFTFDGFQKSERGRLLSWVGNKSLSVLQKMIEKLAGAEFFREMNLFFSQVKELKSEVAHISEELLNQMRKENSQFVLVTSAALDKYDESQYLLQQLQNQDFKVDHCIINQAYYWWLDESDDDFVETDLEANALYNCFKLQKKNALKLVEKMTSGQSTSEVHVIVIPILPVSNIEKKDILEITQLLVEKWVVEN